MFLLIVFLGSGVAAESSTCDASYTDNGNCANLNFGCPFVPLAQQDIPTCFNGLAQSPINLDSSSATVPPNDPGQLTFSGYNDELQQTPSLRLKDFTVQLDFNQIQRKKGRKKKKGQRKTRRRKNDSLKRLSREEDVSLPSISGGALGNNT